MGVSYTVGGRRGVVQKGVGGGGAIRYHLTVREAQNLANVFLRLHKLRILLKFLGDSLSFHVSEKSTFLMKLCFKKTC